MLKYISIFGSDPPQSKLKRSYKICPLLYFFNFDKGRMLCYSPLVGRIYIISKNLVFKLKSNRIEIGNIETLKKLGLVIPSNYDLKPKSEFRYFDNKITLFFTTKCNMRCKYCYARAGEKNISMPLNCVMPAISRILKSQNSAFIKFHGGGEPILEIDKIKKIVNYVKSRVKNSFFYIFTNGTASMNVMHYLLENNFKIRISCDGPPYIQNKQRPLVNGGDSSKIIERNLKMIPKKERWAQATITKYSADKQCEIVDYFRSLDVSNIKFEMVYPMGRAKTQNSIFNQVPSYREFYTNFLKAKELADDYGIGLYTTFIPLDRKVISYCGISGPNICLTPDKYLSTCYMAQNYNKRFDKLIYGKYDENNIYVYEKRINFLRSRTVENMKDCSTCFLKYSCAGGCAFESYEKFGDIFKVDREQCQMRRELNKAYMKYLTERHLVKIKPYLKIKKGKKFLVGFFNTFELNKNLFEIEIKFLSGDFSKVEDKIMNLKKKGEGPVLFLLSIIEEYKSLKNARDSLLHLLIFLKDNGILFKIRRPIKRCFFSSDFRNLLKEYEGIKDSGNCISLKNLKPKLIPSSCLDCLDLFEVTENESIIFCDGIVGKKKINEYSDRNEIFREFQSHKRDLPKMCKNCIFRSRKLREGKRLKD